MSACVLCGFEAFERVVSHMGGTRREKYCFNCGISATPESWERLAALRLKPAPVTVANEPHITKEQAVEMCARYHRALHAMKTYSHPAGIEVCLCGHSSSTHRGGAGQCGVCFSPLPECMHFKRAVEHPSVNEAQAAEDAIVDALTASAAPVTAEALWESLRIVRGLPGAPVANDSILVERSDLAAALVALAKAK